MSFKLVHQLMGFELEPGDFILVPDFDDPVKIESIDILENGYQVNYLDEYGDEMLSHYVDDDVLLDFYVIDDED